MGWFIQPNEDGSVGSTIFFDPGLFGSIAWIDVERNIGGYVAIDHYPSSQVDVEARAAAQATRDLVLDEIMALFATTVDTDRAPQ